MEPKINEKMWIKEFEQPIYEEWKDLKRYAFIDSGRPVYSIDTPPPYVNTPVHIGHATTYAIMDMIARFRRMTGHNVLFPFGMDRNGLPIELSTEKRFGILLKDTPREKFIEYCNKVLEESSIASVHTFLRLGISFNSWELGTKPGDMYYTDSDQYRALTQATFIDMWNKGLVYEANRINNYCIGCGTTLADDEIDYVELPSTFNNIIFKVKETGEDIIIATTRPELICTCGMIIFNPNDDRHKRLEGTTAITPIFEKEVPIKTHPMADPEKGTGLVMMCSAGDQSDIQFFREMGLQAEIAINADGRMNEKAGFLQGCMVKEAREKIINDLKQEGLLVKQMKLNHRTPICERSKDPIEFIAMPEFYLKQVEFKGEIRHIADKINFYSAHSKQILIDWIDNVSIDWAISRRRYYATEIPLWYCKKCGGAVLGEKGRYVKPWKESPPVRKCSCGSVEFVGEERVFDTWFDSSLSALYLMHYPSDFYRQHEPCTLRPQGKEIVRNWLYYTMLRSYLLTKKPIFKDIWIHYHITDEKGKKMSKSLGNIIKPEDILDKLGSEPFRLWCASEGNLNQKDFMCSFDRIEGEMKTLTKLWNIGRFVSMFEYKDIKQIKSPEELDKWIIHEVNELIKYSKSGYSEYDFHNPVIRIKNFIWGVFAPHYIELVKTRVYNQPDIFTKEQQNSGIATLYYCFEQVMKLLAPVIPMFTYKLYASMKSCDIHNEEFPSIHKEHEFSFTTDDIISINSHIWKVKKENKISLNSKINILALPKKFMGIEKDMKAAHNAEKIMFGDNVDVNL